MRRKRGDAAAVTTLLKQGADVSAAHPDGMTPLHWAAERGDAAMADALIRAGANLVGRHAARSVHAAASRRAHRQRPASCGRCVKAGAPVAALTSSGIDARCTWRPRPAASTR